MSELIVGVVPVRSLSDGKTRLASILSSEERSAFIRASGARVIGAALSSRVVDTILVVSPDPIALDWASELGQRVSPLPQAADSPGLNGAIALAREWALERDADRLLSLFADLPLLSPYDVRLLTSRRQSVVLGTDRRHTGTNALLLHLQGCGARFQFAFGDGSLAGHLHEARRLGLDALVQSIPGIAFDLDTPDDWADYLEAEQWQARRAPETRIAAGAKRE